jgi:hypothetical protein
MVKSIKLLKILDLDEHSIQVAFFHYSFSRSFFFAPSFFAFFFCFRQKKGKREKAKKREKK